MPPASERVFGRRAGAHAVAYQREVVAGSLALIAVAGFLGAQQGARLGVLFLIGVLLGVTLYHAAFGFASAYRALIVRREVEGVQAQLLMLALATVLFAPVLARGEIFGHAVAGAVAPAGWPVAIGAFMFGAGMQLGGGCGSGALYTAGGGNPRMVVTLAAFCAGSFWASLHMGVWQQLPALKTESLADVMGYPAAALAQLGFIGVLALALRRWGRRWPSAASPASGRARFIAGPWPLAAGALLLALLNFATLLTAGHPWTITWAFTLWGAKAASLAGWDPGGSAFWAGSFQRGALEAGIFQDVTSVMDIGIVLGALLAAGLAGRFAPVFGVPARSLAAAVIGGLLMGYGARIAYGCNVGAFFSGVASFSLHGWLWLAAALPGAWLGVKLRPRFGLQI